MASEFKKPTCDSCWFAKVKTVREQNPAPDHGVSNYVPAIMFTPTFTEVNRMFCMRNPESIQKDVGDFCHNHPAWPEFEAQAQPRVLSDFYERQSP